MVRAEFDGEVAPELVTQNTRLELEEGTYVIRFDGQISDQGGYELGEANGFGTILIRGIEGSNAGRTIPCIYQHVGDRLRVCYGLGGDVPTEFKTAAGQNRYLATYRRTIGKDRPE